MMSSRRAPVPPDVTIMPPLPERANAATFRSISSVSRTFTGVSSTPRDCATDRTAANCPMPAAEVGSRSTKARVTLGAICLSNSAHLPLMLYSKFEKPVILPPGWAMLCTKPAPTGSGAFTNTIGSVHEHDRDRTSGLLQRPNCHTAYGKDHVRRECDELRGVAANAVDIAPNMTN